MIVAISPGARHNPPPQPPPIVGCEYQVKIAPSTYQCMTLPEYIDHLEARELESRGADKFIGGVFGIMAIVIVGWWLFSAWRYR